jgi:hypothetical protein
LTAKGNDAINLSVGRPNYATGEIVDETKLMDFLHKTVADVGSVLGGSMAVLGDRLGLYRAMAGAGPLTAAELAARTDTTERYVHEWLVAQAASGYLDDVGDGRFALPDEHAVVLTDETSPACLIGAFELALTGAGLGGDHGDDLFDGCEQVFRPRPQPSLVSTWLPALDGVVARLEAGARVVCG